MRPNRIISVSRGVVAVALAIAGLASAFVAASATPAAAVSYQVAHTGGDGVRQRSQPTRNSAYSGVAPEGATVNVQCQLWSEPMGSYNNKLWLYVSRPGTGMWYLPDTYSSSPRNASDPALPGIPMCGSSPAPTPAPSGNQSTPIWVGAPFRGQYAGTGGRPSSSLPGQHASVFTVPGYNYKHDWAMDYYAPAGTGVRLYAAPKDSARNNQVSAQVLNVTTTCKSGRPADGGYVVFVGLYDAGTRVGSLAYAHVEPDFDGNGRVDQSDLNFRGGLNRWGGYIGKVGQYTRNGCWDVSSSAGHHSHLEFANVKNYSCFRSPSAGATLNEHDYIGYLGGSYASGTNKACPSNA